MRKPGQALAVASPTLAWLGLVLLVSGCALGTKLAVLILGGIVLGLIQLHLLPLLLVILLC